MPADVDINEPDHWEDSESDDVEVQGKLDQHNTMLGGIARIGRVVKMEAGVDPIDPEDIVLVNLNRTLFVEIFQR